MADLSRAPVGFGRWAVPQLFAQLQQAEADRRLPVLASLCDIMHDPERLYQTVNGGFLEQLKPLLKDEDPSVRRKSCELIHQLMAHSIGRQALLASSFLPLLSEMLDDSSSSCRKKVYQVLNRLAQQPAGAEALLTLVPKLMQKLRQKEEDEEEELLLSTLSCCCMINPLPALASDGVSLLGHRLSHSSPNIRREAAATMIELSFSVDGKQQVCEQQLLPVLVGLLQDDDAEVQTNAAGVIMNTVNSTAGKLQCLDLHVIPVLLGLLLEMQKEERRRKKGLCLYCLRALTALAEAPEGRRLLLEQLPLLVRRSEEEDDKDVQRAAQTAISVIMDPLRPFDQ